MKRRQTLPDYGASHGKCPKGFRLRNYPAVKRSVESQVPAIFMYRMRHVFSCLVPVSSLCRRRLAYILYESWLLGVFRIYTTLKPRSSEVCSAYAPRLRLGAYALQTSSDLDSRVVYTRNTPRNHDLYITYIPCLLSFTTVGQLFFSYYIYTVY